jgi:hypothetical protein
MSFSQLLLFGEESSIQFLQVHYLLKISYYDYYIRKNPKIIVLGVVKLVSKEQLVQITKSSIDNLITVYALTRHLFYAEHDLHAFLYRDILNRLPMKDWHCKTIDGKLSLLLHEEYPTKERYSEKQLKENVRKGKREHFDVCIWNLEKTSSRRFRVTQSTKFDEEQQTYIAIEFDLVEHSDSLEQAVHHLKWDLMKLKSTKNEVEYGYSLVFVRHWIHMDGFLRQVEAETRREKKVTVLYAEKTRDQKAIIGTLSEKRFLNYKPMFK